MLPICGLWMLHYDKQSCPFVKTNTKQHIY